MLCCTSKSKKKTSSCQVCGLCVCVHVAGYDDLRLLLLGSVSHQSLGVANQCQVNLKPHPGVFCIPSIYLPRRSDLVKPNKISYK